MTALADRVAGWIVVPDPTSAVHAVVRRSVLQEPFDYHVEILEFVCDTVGLGLFRVRRSELLGGPLEASAPMCAQCHARLRKEGA